MEVKYCSITVFFGFSVEISPKNAKNIDFNGFFDLISFLKIDAGLDHFPGSSYYSQISGVLWHQNAFTVLSVLANSFSNNSGSDIANDII